ncbi:MAG: hypothetical protein K2N63_02735 [Lachnospiraceae bacterium]|nr:hypothetical protein [Lachnospiraceae bacterium]
MRGKIHSYLFYPDMEFSRGAGYEQKDELIKDLNLKVIFQAASRPVWKAGDSLKTVEKEDFYIYDIIKQQMLIPILDREALLYRQQVVKTALKHPEMIRRMYEIGQKAGKLLEQGGIRGKEQHVRAGAGSGEVLGTYELLCGFVGLLKELKAHLEAEEELSDGNGFYNLKICLEQNYNEDFAAGLDGVLSDLEFFTKGGKSSFLVSIGAGMKFDRIALYEISSPSSQEEKRKADGAGGILRRIFQTGTVPITEETVLRETKQFETEAFRAVLALSLKPI